MKIVIASGKGGVGKSMLTSALAMLLAKENKVVAVDCDVDAPNLAIWLNEIGKWEGVKKISVSQRPVINNENCLGNCKKCVKKCKFGALYIEKSKLKVNPFLCEGCGACRFFCPSGVITMEPIENGEIRTKLTKYGFPLIVGQLFPGETGSGKVVDKIKAEAEKFKSDLMIIDSAPGTGCPVIAALKDANFTILVSEPTLSGFTDLKRVLEVVDYFQIPWGLVINKWDVNPKLSNKIKKWAGDKFLGKISYDKKIFQAISNLIPILETNLKAKREIENIFNDLKLKLREQK